MGWNDADNADELHAPDNRRLPWAAAMRGGGKAGDDEEAVAVGEDSDQEVCAWG